MPAPVTAQTAAPLSISFAAGQPLRFDAWTPSFVDGAGSKALLPAMWERARSLVAGAVALSPGEVASARASAGSTP